LTGIKLVQCDKSRNRTRIDIKKSLKSSATIGMSLS